MTDHYKQLLLINPYDAPEQAPTAASSHKRRDPTPPTGTANESDDVLKLPDDALVALRKSGGLMFSSREIVVYYDGRIVRRGQGGGQARFEDATQHLPNAQLVALTKLIKRTKFPLATKGAHQSPDTFVYEVAARAGQTLKTIDVAQSSVPTTLKPLLNWLDQHLSPTDT